jgi:hypothetical protein
VMVCFWNLHAEFVTIFTLLWHSHNYRGDNTELIDTDVMQMLHCNVEGLFVVVSRS